MALVLRSRKLLTSITLEIEERNKIEKSQLGEISQDYEKLLNDHCNL